MKTKNTNKIISASICLLMITVALVGVTGSVLADEGWPTLYHDSARTSYSTGLEPVDSPDYYRWIENNLNDGTERTTVIVVDGFVYSFVTIPEPGIKRFNYLNGLEDKEWFIPMQKFPQSNAAMTITNGNIYFHDWYFGGGSFYFMTNCYDIETQEMLWEFNGYDYGSTSFDYGPTVAFGNVYCVDKDARVFCLSASTGNLLWQTEDDLSTPDPVAIDVANDKLFVSTGNDLYCYEATPDGVDDGIDDPPGAEYDIIWIYDGASNGRAPLVNNGFVYASFGDTVYCFHGEDGVQEWNAPLDSTTKDLAIANGFVYVTSNGEYAYCLNATTGTIEWETLINDDNDYLGSPAVAGNIVVVGAKGGHVYCLDATTGDILWEHFQSDSYAPVLTTPAAIYEGWIYILSGELYCFGGSTHYPDTPEELEGPDRGREGVKYWFSTDNVDDLDGNDLYYMFDWGDGEDSGWIGPYEAGEDVEVHSWHRWEQPGDYVVKVKVKDEFDYETEWVEKYLHIDFIEIHGLTGGFGVSAQVKNMADLSKDVDLTIQVAGGYFGFHVFKQDSNGILSLGPGETATIATDGMLFGLGPIEIKIVVETAGESITELHDAFLLGFYVSA